MIYATIKTLYQIKYLQPFAMNILLFTFSKKKKNCYSFFLLYHIILFYEPNYDA